MKDLSAIPSTPVHSVAVKLGGKSDFSPKFDLKALPDLSATELILKEIARPSTQNEDSFFIADVGEVFRQYVKWETYFPDVRPFFAIKANPDPYFLQLLAELGAGFDCASKNEIQQVLSYGVDPSRIIYANPCKPMSHIRFAAANNVRKMTFDNADELRKIKLCHPAAQVVLRILTDDSKSVCQFGIKFGASLASAKMLVALARELELELVGVSFHVGSECFDAESYCDAISRSRKVFDYASEVGFAPWLLDIGGGFPGANVNDGSISLEMIADAVHRSMDLYFPEGNVELISEPGRYFVASAFTLSCNITSRRIVSRESTASRDPLSFTPASVDDHPSYMYYINDGVYGSFNCIMFDHAKITPQVLCRGGHFASQSVVDDELEFESSVWGPTCDSLDVITKQCQLPELQVGDWLYFPDMGAYTACAASEFNGYTKSRIIYTNSSKVAVNSRLNL